MGNCIKTWKSFIVISIYKEEKVLEISYNKIRSVLEKIEKYDYEIFLYDETKKDQNI